MTWTRTRIAALAELVLLLLITAAILVLKREKVLPEETPVVVSQPIDDAFWLNLDRRRSDHSTFLQSFGLELVQAKRPQEWLVMEHVH
jgi:hypothetical protein